MEKATRRSGFSIKRLAEALGVSRNTVYNRFGDPELCFEFIARVSSIIHYDFSEDFPEMTQELISEASVSFLNKNTAELLKLKRKYTDLLERYNKLLSILVRLANQNELASLKNEIMLFAEKGGE